MKVWALSPLIVLSMVVLAMGAETSHQLNQKAIKAAESGNMKEALSLFEQAVAKSPTDSAIINNLGVTYMRTNKMDDAQRMFVQGLQTDPRNNDCFDNLKVLLGFTKSDLAQVMAESGLHEAANVFGVDLQQLPESTAQQTSLSASDSDAARNAATLGEPDIRHNIKRMPHIDVEEFYLPENRDFAEGRRPFILTGLMRQWRNISTAFSFEALAEEFSDSPVDFYAENMRQAGTKPFIQPLSVALDELVKPLDSGRFPYRGNGSRYIHWNVRWHDWQRLIQKLGPSIPFFTTDDAWLEGCLPSAKLRNEHLLTSHWRMLLIANGGGGMFNHKDTLMTSSFQYQLVGRKKWHLCSPANDAVFEAKGGDRVEENMFKPDYAANPALLDADCYVDTAEAGEVLYYPRGYWHQTINVDTRVVAITGTLVDANNYDTVALMLDKDCEKNGKINLINPSPELCSYYRSHCFPWWRHAWGDTERMYAVAQDKKHFDTAPTMVRPWSPTPRTTSESPMEPSFVPGEFTCGSELPFSLSEMAAPESTEYYG